MHRRILKARVGLISIDPGTKKTGVALWPLEWCGGLVKPLAVHLLKGKGKDWQVSSESVRSQLAAVLQAYNTHQAKTVCEQPQYLASKMVTTTSGALVKMAHLCGLLASVAPGFTYVGINEWKGNLPKDVVIKRIKRYYASEPLVYADWKDDAWDAVGVGLYQNGEF